VRSALVAAASIALVASACGSSDASGPGGSSGGSPYSTETRSGVITYYAADGGGSCGFDPSPNDLDVAAFDAADFAGSATCGACVRVTGPKGVVTVRIVDQCPECERGHLDLSKQAFAKIADVAAGHVEVSFQMVACDVTGNIAYHIKEGSSKWWTAIQIRNHRLPIAKLEYRKGGAFVEMKREDYNYFVDESGVGDQPSGLAVRVTASDGQTLEDTLPGTIQPDTTIEGKAQFR
jgi:expansin (peptidoglycan-binding protein)